MCFKYSILKYFDGATLPGQTALGQYAPHGFTPKADRRPPLTIDKSPDKFYEDFRTI